jgi:hypothetical protein
MHAVIDSLHSFFSSFLNSPHHLGLYIAIAVAAVLLVGMPLIRVIRAIFGSRTAGDSPSVETASPSMLGLASSPVDVKPAPLEFTPAPASNVTAINEALTVKCIHCSVTISSREDFCPACGYAQPVKQGLLAAFPA